MSISERLKYKVDKTETFFENLVYGLQYVVIILFILLGFQNLGMFENEISNLMSLVIFFFSITKIIQWAKSPVVIFKHNPDYEKRRNYVEKMEEKES